MQPTNGQVLSWNNSAGCWEPGSSGGSPDTSVYLTRATDQAGTDKYVRSTSGNDTYVGSVTPALTAYTRGGCFVLDADTANTGTATVNINGLGAKSILNRAGGALSDGDITANAPITICYDGTQFIIQGDGGSGSGATAVTGLTDCKVTATSTTVTIAACRYEYTASDGRNTTVAISSATWAVSAGTESGTGRFEIDPNGGSPIIRCIYSSGMTASNYTATGCTETSGEDFSVGTKQLGTVALSGGAWTTVTDYRSMLATHTVAAGTGLSKSGNVMSLNTGTSITWGAAQASDSTYNYCADTGANDTYACTISPAITAYATGAHYFFKANTVNTGAATINFNSLGAKTIKKYTSTGGADLADADIRAGAIVELVYDGTDMQLVNQLGNAGGGGTPGGSNTHVQFNNSSAFGGDAGFTWDNTNKLVTVTRSNSGAIGGRIKAVNSAATSLNQHALVEACGDGTTTCAQVLNGYMNNYDGLTSNFYWTALRYLLGTDYYNVVSRKGTTDPVHLGGDVNNGLGWFSVTSGGVNRFANANTAGLGLAPIVAAPSELTGQTGDVAASNLLSGSHTAGTYRVCGFVAVTAAGTGSTAAWTLSWRSPASGTDLTHNILWSSGGAETATFSVAAADEFNVCKVIRSTGTSAIALNPGDMNTATYTTAWTVERLR